MFATEVKEIVTMRNFKTIPAEKNLEEISKRLDAFSYESKLRDTFGIVVLK